MRLLRIAGLALLGVWAIPAAAHGCTDGSLWIGTWADATLTLRVLDSDTAVFYTGNDLRLRVLKEMPGSRDRWEERDAQDRKVAEVRLDCFVRELRGERLDPAGASIRAQLAEDEQAHRHVAQELAVLKTVHAGRRSLELVSPRAAGSIATIRIRKPSRGEAAINAELQASLLRSLQGHLECRMLERKDKHEGLSWGTEEEVNLSFWRGPFLGLQVTHWTYCGGPHGDGSSQQRLFDTRSGTEIPIGAWLQARYGDRFAVDTPLGRRVVGAFLGKAKTVEQLPVTEQECAQAALELPATARSVSPRGMGFGFAFPYAGRGCDAEVVVPWARVVPFLSPAGRQWLRLLQSHGRS